MTAYLAAPYSERKRALEVLRELELNGVEVTSTWLTAAEHEMSDEWAQIDLADVARADVFVALNFMDWTECGRGGRHVELGYALALGKRIVLVGERSNIFHFHHAVQVIAESDDLGNYVATGTNP